MLISSYTSKYVDVSSENGAFFSNESRLKLILRKLESVENFSK